MILLDPKQLASDKLVAEIAKDLAIAKLSRSAPNTTDKASGENIGKMYTAIYEEVSKVLK